MTSCRIGGREGREDLEGWLGWDGVWDGDGDGVGDGRWKEDGMG